jgi:hypothetical protein
MPTGTCTRGFKNAVLPYFGQVLSTIMLLHVYRCLHSSESLLVPEKLTSFLNYVIMRTIQAIISTYNLQTTLLVTFIIEHRSVQDKRCKISITLGWRPHPVVVLNRNILWSFALILCLSIHRRIVWLSVPCRKQLYRPRTKTFIWTDVSSWTWHKDRLRGYENRFPMKLLVRHGEIF